MNINIRLLYLYLFSFVGLLLAVIGCMRLVDLGLKVYVFRDADKYMTYPAVSRVDPSGKEVVLNSEEAKKNEEDMKKAQEEETKRQRQRELASALSMIIVGTPLYVYHWKTIQRENKDK